MIDMRFQGLYFLFFSCFMLSCGSDSPPPASTAPTPSIAQNALKKRVVLVIDASSSITQESKSLAAGYARQIANTLPDESHLLIYSTEKNTTQQALVDIKKETPLKPSLRSDYESRVWPANVKKVYDVVLAKCNQGASVSCILDGLKSVRAGLAGATPAQETYLLIVSDMLECCELGCPAKPKDFVGMTDKLEKSSDLAEFELLSKIPKEHVKICYINQNAKSENATMIASPEFRTFWRKSFALLGYNEMPEPGTSIDAFLEMIK